MPSLKKGESKDSFISRCIPQVKEEGTAESNDQAVAICHDMYRRQSNGRQKLEKQS